MVGGGGSLPIHVLLTNTTQIVQHHTYSNTEYKKGAVMSM